MVGWPTELNILSRVNMSN